MRAALSPLHPPASPPICANKRNTRRFVPTAGSFLISSASSSPHPRHLAQSINCLHSPLHMTVIPLSPQRLQLTLHPLHTLYFGSLRRLLRLRTPGGKLTHDPRKRLLRHPQLPCLAAQHLHRLRIPPPPATLPEPQEETLLRQTPYSCQGPPSMPSSPPHPPNHTASRHPLQTHRFRHLHHCRRRLLLLHPRHRFRHHLHQHYFRYQPSGLPGHRRHLRPRHQPPRAKIHSQSIYQ